MYCIRTQLHVHNYTDVYTYFVLCTADGQAVGFSVDYTSDSGFFLSWSLPQLAVHSDVSVWGFNLEYTSDSGVEGSIVIPYPSGSAKDEEFTGAVTMLTDASQPYSLSLVVNYSNPILLSDAAMLDGQSLLMMGMLFSLDSMHVHVRY